MKESRTAFQVVGFHTILQNFRQEKVEIFLFYAKAGFFGRFVKIVCTTL
jgi:hypothetical protein